MRGFYLFVTSLLIIVHFWRFPHLVLENGGGAFVVLFMACLFGLGLPVFVAELCFERLFPGRRNVPLIDHSRMALDAPQGPGFLRLQRVVQPLILFFLFHYFFYLASLAFVHFHQTVFSVFPVVEWGALRPPGLAYRYGLCIFLFAVIAGLSSERLFLKFLDVARWALVFCLLVFVCVLWRILSVGSVFEGLKTIFYPDFLKLGWGSLQQALSHAFASMALGMGWSRSMHIRKRRQDLVSIGASVAVLSMLVAFVSCLLALPMVEQLQEKAFGANWIFFILPRWLGYTTHGGYYSGLFFLAILFISVYLCVQIQFLFRSHWPLGSFWSRKSVFFAVSFFHGVLLVTVFSLNRWWGIGGQSLFQSIDYIFVAWVLPANVLMGLWALLFTSSSLERQKVLRTFVKKPSSEEEESTIRERPLLGDKVVAKYQSLWEALCFRGVPFLLLFGAGLSVVGFFWP